MYLSYTKLHEMYKIVHQCCRYITRYIYYVSGDFKLVKIQLNGSNVRETVIQVLHACDIPTNYVDKIPPSQPKPDFK